MRLWRHVAQWVECPGLHSDKNLCAGVWHYVTPCQVFMEEMTYTFDYCHDCDRTYPCSPYPDLSTPILSHQNHPRAPNATPEPSGSIPSQLASQQRTPEHSDSPASSRRIPNLTLLRPFLFPASSQFPTSTLIPDPMPFDLLCSCVKSIPNVSSVS